MSTDGADRAAERYGSEGYYQRLVTAGHLVPDLANALNKVANELASLGRLPEGLGRVDESIQLHDEYVYANPEAAVSDVDTALINRAAILRRLGRRVAAFRDLARALPMAKEAGCSTTSRASPGTGEALRGDP